MTISSKENEQDSGPKHRLPAVDRAIRVLDLLAAGPSSLADLSTSLRVPRSTVYRIINSLHAGRLVMRESDGSYALGPAILRLARSTPNRSDIISVAHPTLELLANDCGETVKLSRLDGDDALVVDVVVGTGNYSVSTQIGRRFPIPTGAASKVLAANLPEKEMEELVARTAPKSGAARTKLIKELAEVRKLGYATEDGTFSNGIHAIAAPVFDALGHVVAAISVPYLPSPKRKVPALRDKIINAAKAVSADLGG